MRNSVFLGLVLFILAASILGCSLATPASPAPRATLVEEIPGERLLPPEKFQVGGRTIYLGQEMPSLNLRRFEELLQLANLQDTKVQIYAISLPYGGVVTNRHSLGYDLSLPEFDGLLIEVDGSFVDRPGALNLYLAKAIFEIAKVGNVEVSPAVRASHFISKGRLFESSMGDYQWGQEYAFRVVQGGEIGKLDPIVYTAKHEVEYNTLRIWVDENALLEGIVVLGLVEVEDGVFEEGKLLLADPPDDEPWEVFIPLRCLINTK